MSDNNAFLAWFWNISDRICVCVQWPGPIAIVIEWIGWAHQKCNIHIRELLERIDVSMWWGEGAVGATAANTSKQNVWRSMYSVWSRALSSLHDKSRSHIIVICFRHCNQLLLVIDNELPGCCSVVRHCCSLRVPHTNYNEILTAINNRLRSYSWIQIEINC